MSTSRRIVLERDERMGWMADALLFAPIASYTYDISGFMAKWCHDVLDARTPHGGFADVAPRPSSRWPGPSFVAGAPVWADAGVLLPWLMYERYGDEDVLEAMFPAMQAWLSRVHEQNPDGIWRPGAATTTATGSRPGLTPRTTCFSTCWLYRSTVVGGQVAEPRSATLKQRVGCAAEPSWSSRPSSSTTLMREREGSPTRPRLARARARTISPRWRRPRRKPAMSCRLLSGSLKATWPAKQESTWPTLWSRPAAVSRRGSAAALTSRPLLSGLGTPGSPMTCCCGESHRRSGSWWKWGPPLYGNAGTGSTGRGGRRARP